MVIPTYNWATVLPWSIGSVLAQSFAEWELWVIGDGCTDESAATVATFDDPRVHWHNLAVNGRSQVGPNNAALARADGCLLYTSDAADDLLCVDLGGRRIIKKKNTGG